MDHTGSKAPTALQVRTTAQELTDDLAAHATGTHTRQMVLTWSLAHTVSTPVWFALLLRYPPKRWLLHGVVRWRDELMQAGLLIEDIRLARWPPEGLTVRDVMPVGEEQLDCIPLTAQQDVTGR